MRQIIHIWSKAYQACWHALFLLTIRSLSRSADMIGLPYFVDNIWGASNFENDHSHVQLETLSRQGLFCLSLVNLKRKSEERDLTLLKFTCTVGFVNLILFHSQYFVGQKTSYSARCQGSLALTAGDPLFVSQPSLPYAPAGCIAYT